MVHFSFYFLVLLIRRSDRVEYVLFIAFLDRNVSETEILWEEIHKLYTKT